LEFFPYHSNQYTRQIGVGVEVEVLGRRRQVINDPSSAEDSELNGLLELTVPATAAVDVDFAGRARQQIEWYFGGAAAFHQVRDNRFGPQ